MTNETSYREKGRALFLAALMVMSVVAMSAAFAGGAAAATQDKNDIDGQLYFAGETFEVDGFDDNEQVQLRSGDNDSSSFEENLRANDTGVVTVDTEDLDGEYILRSSDGTNYGPFEVTVQNVEFEFENDEIASGDETTLNFVDDNRGADVSVLIDADDDLDEEELEGIFAGASAYDGDDDVDQVQVDDVAEDDEIDADFEDIDAGNYTFTVNVYDTTASDEAQIEVGDEVDADAQFDQSTYEQNVGDVAEFTVEHDSTDDVYVNVTDEDEFYTATLYIDDIEDEDNVTVEFNSYKAGHGDDAFDVDEGDLTVVDQTNIDSEFNLVAGDYELEAYVEDPQDGADEVDAAVLLLNDRSTGDMNTWVAPGDLDLDDVDLDAIEESATERDYVAEGDHLITQVEASGIYGYAFDDGNWDDGEGLEFNFNDTEQPRYGDADSFTLGELDDEDYTIVVDEDANTFFVVVDIDEVDVDDVGLNGDETWDAEFVVNEDNPYVDEDDEEVADAQFDVEERDLELVGEYDDDDRFLVENSANAELTAETNVAPGTEGDFRLRATSEIYTDDAEVDADGMISSTFDLSSHEAGDELRTVRASVADTDPAETEGVFIDAEEEPEEDAEGLEWDVDVDPAEPVEGDDVDVTVSAENVGEEMENASYEFYFAGDLLLDGDVELEGEESESWTDTVEDAEAGDYEWELKVDGDVELEDTLTVAEEDEPTDDDADADAGDADADADADADDDGEADDGEDDGTPGFGVAVAVVALLAAAMLALRRQN
ncbi:BGTF surface domain-containing protein [Natronorubrum sp. A-ect3]|uniref:BGTF surface domain-containing protein n=1 Tax=Natronorubrum sp. A-ect3 TaxID=3242698 RepID=UPI00359D4A24